MRSVVKLQGSEKNITTQMNHAKISMNSWDIKNNFYSTIVAVGDSITNGVYGMGLEISRLSLLWRRLLERKLNESGFPVRVINAGIACDRVKGVLNRLDDDVLYYKPDYVTVLLGLNDSWLDEKERIAIPPKLFGHLLNRIVERCRLNNAEPVFITPNPMTEVYSYWGQRKKYLKYGVNCVLISLMKEMKNIAKKERVDLIDIYNIFVNYKDYKRALVPDGLHPNKEGNRLIALELFNYFKQKYEKKKSSGIYGKEVNLKIVAIGDTFVNNTSCMNGLMDRHSYTWCVILERLLNNDISTQVINSGIAGERSSAGLERFFDDVLWYKPTYVLICYGQIDSSFNSVNRQIVLPEDFRINLKKMIEKCRSFKACPVLVTPIPIPSYSEERKENLYELVKIIRQVAKVMKCDIVDVYEHFDKIGDLDSLTYPDMPSRLGNRLIAEVFYDYFKV